MSKMQDVFEELLWRTAQLRCNRGHYYNGWSRDTITGEWRSIEYRLGHFIGRFGREWFWDLIDWGAHGNCPNFSAYVRHHQNQYNNNE